MNMHLKSSSSYADTQWNAQAGSILSQHPTLRSPLLSHTAWFSHTLLLRYGIKFIMEIIANLCVIAMFSIKLCFYDSPIFGAIVMSSFLYLVKHKMPLPLLNSVFEAFHRISWKQCSLFSSTSSSKNFGKWILSSMKKFNYWPLTIEGFIKRDYTNFRYIFLPTVWICK